MQQHFTTITIHKRGDKGWCIYAKPQCRMFVEENRQIQGFIALEQELSQRDRGLVTYLFIHPNAIGRGYGQALWNRMVDAARDSGIRAVLVHSDPHAEPFYVRMGARRIGEVASTVFPDRHLPVLETIV